jgi:hypothetical protein
VAHKDDAGHHEDRGEPSQRDAVERGALQHQHQHGDRQHEQQRALIVDLAMAGLHVFRQEQCDHADRRGADR